MYEQQYDFMQRKTTTDTTFALWMLLEKKKTGQTWWHCVFVGLEKINNRIRREELWFDGKVRQVCCMRLHFDQSGARTAPRIRFESFLVCSCHVGRFFLHWVLCKYQDDQVHEFQGVEESL